MSLRISGGSHAPYSRLTLLMISSFSLLSLVLVSASGVTRPLTSSLLAGSGYFGIKDYCQFETFNASCPAPDHVIVMTTARYGRMAEGRCTDKKYGFIGCAIEVLPLVDSRCSGRPSCRVTVVDFSVLHGVQPCPPDLTSYFEASYRCVKVEMPAEPPCSPIRYTKLTSSSGFLTSVPPIQRSAPSNAMIGRACRWLIETEAGRRVNLTMYDFTMTSSTVAMATATCRRLAVVRDLDSGRETNICTGSERIRHVHVSDSNRVEITMVASNSGAAGPDAGGGSNSPYFLIRYEVIGCSRTNLPSFSGATVELSADGETALVECDVRNHVRWIIRCIDSQWRTEGDVGNCTTSFTENGEMVEDGHVVWSGILPHGWTSPYGVVAVISLGVLFGLIIGSSLLGVAVCLLKWKRRSSSNRRTAVDRLEPTFHDNDDDDYMPGCHVISDTTTTTQKRGCDCGILWPQADRYGLTMLHHHHHHQHHQMQQQQPQQLLHQSETLPIGKTYVSHIGAGIRRLSVMATPDLFVNASPTYQPEVTCPDVESSPPVVGRMATERHLNESQIMSHHRKVLLE